MKMKKLFSAFWIITLGVMMMFSMTGCGNPTTDQGTGDTTTETETETETDVKSSYHLSTANEEIPPGLTLVSALKKNDVVTIKLGGTVVSGFQNDVMEAAFLGGNTEGHRANFDLDDPEGFSYVALAGIIKEGRTIKTLKEENRSLNLFKTVDPSNIFNHTEDNVYKTTGKGDEAAAYTEDNTFGFLLWGGATQAKVTVTTKDEGIINLVIDWSAVTFDTEAKYNFDYELSSVAGELPDGLFMKSATEKDAVVTIKLGGTVASGFTGPVKPLFVEADESNFKVDDEAGYTWCALTNIIVTGKTVGIKQTNQSLNLYKYGKDARIHGLNQNDSFSADVYWEMEGSAPAEADDTWAFLLWNGAQKKTADIEVTWDDGDPKIIVVDWTGVVFN